MLLDDYDGCTPGTTAYLPFPGLEGSSAFGRMQTTMMGNLIGWIVKSSPMGEFSIF